MGTARLEERPLSEADRSSLGRLLELGSHEPVEHGSKSPRIAPAQDLPGDLLDVEACFRTLRRGEHAAVCALCLLDGADGGTCGSGGPCCPNPSFPSSVSACASLCQ